MGPKQSDASCAAVVEGEAVEKFHSEASRAVVALCQMGGLVCTVVYLVPSTEEPRSNAGPLPGLHGESWQVI